MARLCQLSIWLYDQLKLYEVQKIELYCFTAVNCHALLKFIGQLHGQSIKLTQDFNKVFI